MHADRIAIRAWFVFAWLQHLHTCCCAQCSGGNLVAVAVRAFDHPAGDLILADADGVVVLAPEKAGSCLELREERFAIDEQTLASLKAGDQTGPTIARLRKWSGTAPLMGNALRYVYAYLTCCDPLRFVLPRNARCVCV